MIKLLHTWQCNRQENFSDQRYITFCIEKHRIILQDFDYNGVKYITSEKGFQLFETNFMKEIKNNFRIWETLDIDKFFSEILTLELDIEKVVGKYQDSLVAANKNSFKIRQQRHKTIEHKSVSWWTEELTTMRKKINAMRRRYQRTRLDNNLRESRKLLYLQKRR